MPPASDAAVTGFRVANREPVSCHRVHFAVFESCMLFPPNLDKHAIWNSFGGSGLAHVGTIPEGERSFQRKGVHIVVELLKGSTDSYDEMSKMRGKTQAA